MDFNFQEKSREDAHAMMTENQKNKIYNEYLSTLKLKISQISLLAPQVSTRFLEEYNDILQKEDTLGPQEILDKIVELEFKIDEYEKKEGKKLAFEVQSKSLMEKIRILQEKKEQMNLEEFEQEFLQVKKLYQSNFTNYSYRNRDRIGKYLYDLQVEMIVRKTCEQEEFDIYNEIQQEDETNLLIAINNRIAKCKQSEDVRKKEIGNEIHNCMLNRTDEIYDPKIWELLKEAFGHPKVANISTHINSEQLLKETGQLSKTAEQFSPLIEKKKFQFPKLFRVFSKKIIMVNGEKLVFSNRIKIFDKEINVKKLSNINIDWLTKQVQETILADFEKQRLQEENRREEKLYIPNPKFLLYSCISQIETVKHVERRSYTFYNEQGHQVEVSMRRSGVIGSNSYIMRLDNIDTSEKTLDCWSRELGDEIAEILEYSRLIDRITGNTIQQQLYYEIGCTMEKYISHKSGSEREIRSTIMKNITEELPIYSNLKKSLQKAKEEVNNKILEFTKQEEERRKEFYGRSYKDTLRVDMHSEMKAIEIPYAKKENIREGLYLS